MWVSGREVRGKRRFRQQVNGQQGGTLDTVLGEISAVK